MSPRLRQIEIRNFKAFRAFELTLEGRHLLLYGPNGSGKSSLYWALYTFLQSARKTAKQVSRYFDSSEADSLLNIYDDPSANPGAISLTFGGSSEQGTCYRISKDAHETYRQPTILKADLASDFITYRFLFGFSHFRNSQKFDVWSLFEREILPFCVSTKGGASSPIDIWERVKSGVANPAKLRARPGRRAYDEFIRDTENLADALAEITDSISREAQRFYDEHFARRDPKKIELRLGLTARPNYARATKRFSAPVMEFGVKIGGQVIARPQAFLNEAKLTQLALSVRLAAALVNLQESELKLLVLDDLLVSLDMDNRMKVVEILLSETFANYQKIILTHDLGFFKEWRRVIAVEHPNWCFQRLQGNSLTGVKCVVDKTEVQKAQEYLHGHNLNEAAICLRKAAEDTARRYREWTEKKQLPPGEFFTLTENLKAARNKLLEGIPARLYESVLRDAPNAHRAYLLPLDDADLDTIPGLDAADRGKVKSRRQKMRRLLKDEHWAAMENVKVIDEVIRTTERVLNPAAHGGESPLYETEVQRALDLISKLEECLA